MSEYLQENTQKFLKRTFKTLFFLALLFQNNWLNAQCAGNDCSVCNVTATIVSITNATIDVGTSTIPGTVTGSGIGSTLGITSTGCGEITMKVSINFDWQQGQTINWIHGIANASSPGWTVAQGSNPGGGWLWQNSITGCCSGATYGEGYYFDQTTQTSFCCGGATPGNPADNYGINCMTSCPSFLFDLTFCPLNGGDVTEGIQFILTDDGETGDWNNPAGCIFALNFPIDLNSTGTNLPDAGIIGPVCEGEAVILDAGLGCSSYSWSGGGISATSPQIVVNPTMTTDYCVVVDSGTNGCQTEECVQVITQECCDALAGVPVLANPMPCTGDPIAVDVTGNNTDPTYTQVILLVDDSGIIVNAIFGSTGIFPPFMVPVNYEIYSYNYNPNNSCGDPFVLFPIAFVDCSFGGCGELVSIPLNVTSCCSAAAGTPTADPANACPGGSVTAEVTGNSTDPGNVQSILLVDDTGTITSVAIGTSTTTFQLGLGCTTYDICSYNYDAVSGTAPIGGTSFSAIDCSASCCETSCTTVSTMDSEFPMFTNPPPATIMLNCAGMIPPPLALNWTDNCDGAGAVMPTDVGSIPPGCVGGTITRTWTYTDACGNETPFEQIITATPDNEGPVFDSTPDATLTLMCGGSPPPVTPLTWTDNCDLPSVSNPTDAGSLDGCNGGSIIRTWEAEDMCGNITTFEQTITVEPDTEGPVFDSTPDATLTLMCGGSPPPVTPLTWTDNCDLPSVSNPTDAGSLDGCNGGSIIRTWEAEDMCGNITTFEQTITVEPDTEGPVFDSTPDATLTLMCGGNPPPATPLTWTDNCDLPSVSNPTDAGSLDGCNGGSIIRTWEAEDMCGNITIFEQTITVEPDTEGPVFDSTPDATLTLMCGGNPPPATPLTWTDNCDLPSVSNPTDAGSLDGCNGGSIIRTWEAEDLCGNITIFEQTITVEPDTEGPVFDSTPDATLTLMCGGNPPPATPLTWTDNCDLPSVSSPTDAGSFDACSGGTITRTWEAEDMCGNITIFEQTITVEPDTEGPVFDSTPDATLTLMCGGNPPPATPLTWTDNCDLPSVSNPTDAGSLDGCNGGSIIRTWEAEDMCGNITIFEQTITVEPDTEGPVFDSTPDAVLTLMCGGIAPPATPLTWTDNCDLPSASNPTDVGFLDGCNGGSIIRTWEAEDMCGNITIFEQTITVEPDTEGPVFDSTPDATLTLMCGGNPPPATPLTWTDNCDFPSASNPMDVGFLDGCNGGSIIRTWEAEDMCGNITIFEQTITVEPDTEGPVFDATPDAVLTLMCGGIAPPATPLTWTDNCDFPSASNPMDVGSLDGCDGGTITRTWEAEDMCGNLTIFEQTITALPDTEGPVFDAPLPPVSVELACGEQLPPIPLTWTDGCGAAGVASPIDDGTIDACSGGTITRTWEAEDLCGNITIFEQTIVVNPPDPAAFLTMPADVTLTCGQQMPPPIPLQYDNGALGACQSIGVVNPVPIGDIDPCVGGTIIYEWNDVDACGTPLLYTQTIVVEETPAPMFLTMPADVTLTCGQPIPPLLPLQYDNGVGGICQLTSSVDGVQTGFIDDCLGGTLEYTWDDVDACGNPLFHTQIIVVEPSPPADFTAFPADVTLECGQPIPPLIDLQYDNGLGGLCQNIGFVSGEEVLNDTDLPCTGGTIVYEWNGEDACGNPLLFSQTITINAGPITDWVGFLPVDVTIDCGTPLPPLVDLQYDNLAGGLCQIGGFVPGEMFGSTDPCEGGVVTYEWNDVDFCGNALTYIQNITINPPAPPQFLFLPPDLTVECTGIPPAISVLYDNGGVGECSITGIIDDPIIIDDEGNCPRTIERIYEYADPCTNTFISHTQTILVDDQQPPFFTEPTPPDMVICDINNFDEPFPLAWLDNCDGEGFADPEVFINPDGSGIVVTWSAVDLCGNLMPAVQNIFVGSTEPVQIIGPPEVCEGIPVTLCVQPGPYVDYDWSTTETNPCIDVTLGGDYLITVTDVNGCTTTGSFALQGNQAPVAAIDGNLNICSGQSTTLTASGGTDYFWSVAGENNANLTVSTPGTYCVTVDDGTGLGCFDETCVTVEENDTPIITITGEDMICEGETATLTASGAGSYAWSTGETNTSVITVTTSQTVTVTGTSTNGCVGTATFDVLVTPNPTPTIDGLLAICEGGTTTLSLTEGYDAVMWSTGDNTATTVVNTGQTVSVTVTNNNCTGTAEVNVIETPNPTPDITGSLSFCTGTNTTLQTSESYAAYLWSPNGETSPTISVSAAGTYAVMVTDMNGCTGTQSVMVIEDAQLSPNVSGSDFCEGATTTLDAGAGFTSYMWLGGETTQTITVSTAGTYTVEVSDGTCTGTGSITVNAIPNPIVDLGQDQAICDGNGVTLDAGGSGLGYTYMWDNGSLNQTRTVNASGTYSVTVTNPNGNCTGTDEIEITIDSAMPPTITGDTEICTGETTTLDAGAAYAMYAWSSGESTQTIDVDATGQYIVTVTDNSGCTATASTIVNETTIQTPNITGNMEICEGEMTTLTANGGPYDSYSWSPSGGDEATATVSGGVYTLEVVLNGCMTSSMVTVIETANPTPTISGDLSYCAGTSTILDAGSYDSYLWSNNATSQTISPSSDGEYCVTVTNAGCTGSVCVTITEIASPEPMITGTASFCEGETTTLDAGLGFATYTWSDGTTMIGSTQTITVDATGTYSVVVTNAENCEGTDQFNVTENTPQQVTINGSETFCTGSSVTLTATGGTYTNYDWSTGESTSSIIVDATSMVTVTVMDNNGCTSTDSFSVTESDGLEPVVTGDSPFCQGETTTLDAGAGFANYLWSANAGGNTQTVTVAAAGTYSVTVSDESGCSGIGSITVTQVDAITPSIDGDDFCEGTDMVLSVTETYDSYLWDVNGNVNPSITVTESGTYSVTVSDANACTGETAITVAANSLPEPDLGTDVSLCTGFTETLNPGTFFSYVWQDASTNPTYIADATGTYSVTVTSNEGCTAVDEIEVSVENGLQPTIIPDMPAFCQGESVTIQVAETFETYTWSNGETTQAIEVTLPGNYSVIVTDINGCTGTTNIAVIQNTNPTPTITGSSTFCTGTSTILDAGGYEVYEWSNGATTQTIEVTTAGEYCVTVTDINGCTGSTCITVTESTSLEPIIAGMDFCEGETMTLDAGAGFTTYVWSTPPGGTEQTITVDEGGTYSVTVTNISGCTGEGSITIVENPIPTVTLGDNQLICAGETTILDAGPGYDSYFWSNGETTQTTEWDTGGDVTVTVTSSGCSATASVLIEIEQNPIPNIAGSLSFCVGTATPLDAGSGYASYLWSPTGETTQTIAADMATTYSVIVTTANGCTGEDMVTLTEATSLSPIVLGDPEFCFGLTTTLTTGVFDSYTWSTGDTTQSTEADETGTYMVTVSDASGCTGIGSYDVVEGSEMNLAITGDSDYCQGESSILDAGAGYTSYIWSNGATTQTTEVVGTLGDNEWCVTVTNEINCTASVCTTTTLNENPVPAIAGSASFCLGGSSILDAGAFNATYEWSPNGETSQTIEVTEEGTYSVTVTTTAGCTGTDSFSVTLESELSPTIAGETFFCFDETSVLSAATIFETYEWSPNGETTPTITVDATGDYTVTVSDASGCTGQATVSVVENPEILLSIAGDEQFCFNESSTLEASAGFASYQWSPNGETTQTIAVASSGDWCVTVTDDEGCTATTCFTTEQTPESAATITGSPNFCIGGSSTLTASTGNDQETYLWSTNETTATITVDTPGDVSVTVTYGFGCTSETMVTVIESTELAPAIGGDMVFCSGDMVTLDGGSGFESYLWSTGESTQMIDVNAEGTYGLTVEDASGCSGTTETFVAEEIPPNAGTGLATTQCQDETTSVDLTTLVENADAGGTWTPDPTNPSFGGFDPAGGTFDGTGQNTGTYVFNYTATGDVCPDDIELVSVVINEQPTVVIGGVQTLTCAEPNSTLTSTGSTMGGTYSWTDADGIEISTESTVTIGAAGTYTLTIDVNGCTNAETYVIDADGDFPTAVTPLMVEIDCANPETVLTVTTDAMTASFEWTGPNMFSSSEQNPTVSEPGLYTVTVTNLDNGCSTPANSLVENNGETPDVTIQAQPTVNFDCTVEAIILNANIVDGGDNLNIEWFLNGEPINLASDIELIVADTGTYLALVTNEDSGCTGEESIYIGELTLFPLVDIPDPDMLTCDVTEVTLFGSVVTTGDDNSYLWTDAAGNQLGTEPTLIVTEPGAYTLSGTDNLIGCENNATQIVIQNIDEPTANAGEDIDIPCDDDEAALNGSGSTGANGSINYTWTGPSIINGSTTAAPTVNQAGTYNLLITDDLNGCTSTDAVDVTVSEDPQIDGVTAVGPGCADIVDGSISIDNVINGTAPYMYSIDGGNTFSPSNTFNFLGGGTYNIVVEDASGCQAMTTEIVPEGGTLTVDLGLDLQVSPGEETQLSVQINDIPSSEIDSTYVITWTPATGLSCTDCLEPTAMVSTETVYTVTVEAPNGCIETDQIVLRVEVDVNVYVPSAFSPNDDGVNDYLTVFTSDQIELVKLLRVYDRWGNKVYEGFDFEPNQLNFGWDGTYQGKKLDPAVFVWYAEIEMPSGRVEFFEGDVTILR